MVYSSLPRAVPLLLLLLSIVPAQAGPQPPQVELQAVVSPHRHLYATAFAGDEGVAVGALGAILETHDGGLSWAERSIDKPLALLAVTLAGERAVAVGQMGLVALREGGAWRVLQAPTDERLLGVAVNSAGLGLAVGSFGTVLRTRNGGGDWQPLQIEWDDMVPGGYEPHLYDAHIDAHGRMLVIGEFGLVLRSKDGGEHWTLLHRGDESLFALHVNGTMLMAVGQEGAVLRSRDDGNTWTMVETGVTANLLGIGARPGRKELLAPGMRSILYSSDGGDSWREIEHADFGRGWYGDAAWSPSSGGFVVVGHGGHIKSITGTE